MNTFMHLKVFVFLTLVVKNLAAKEVSNQSKPMNMGHEITEILNNILKDYDKRVRPNYGENPVTVGVTMYVLSFSSFSETDMDYTMDFYFRQMWNDPRLTFTGPPGVNTISLDSEFSKELWLPDTFFVNEKKSFFHETTTFNELLRISSAGDVVRSSRLTVTASCPMDLRYFPMDKQLCTLEIENFVYTLRDIRYQWAKGRDSVGMSSDVSLPQLKVVGYRHTLREVRLSTGNYSRLACEIQFARSMGYYIIQFYIPAGISVVISWISFWINRNSTTARIAHGVTTVLTMATLMSSVNATLPKISYVKAIDIYLAMCFLMVFASLLENTCVGYMKKRIQIRKDAYIAKQSKIVNQNMCDSGADEENKKDQQQDKSNDAAESANGDIETLKLDKICWCITPVRIDMCSRILFPSFFIIFNICYWMIYLRLSGILEKDLVVSVL